jgi:hypothetical protein
VRLLRVSLLFLLLAFPLLAAAAILRCVLSAVRSPSPVLCTGVPVALSVLRSSHLITRARSFFSSFFSFFPLQSFLPQMAHTPAWNAHEAQ